MSYSKSGDITREDYHKLVPKFLELLTSYGYTQAKIRSPLQFKKGDAITTFSDLTVKEVLDKLTKEKFYSGKIHILHKEKSISLSRSKYTHDFTLELSFQPDIKLKRDFDKLFPKKKKLLSPGKEADASKKASKKEMDKEMKERKKKYS